MIRLIISLVLLLIIGRIVWRFMYANFDGARMLKDYSLHDLERLIEFERRSRTLQEAHLKRILALSRRSR